MATQNQKKYIKINDSIEFLRAMPNTSSASCNGITAIYNSSFKKNNLRAIKGIRRFID